MIDIRYGRRGNLYFKFQVDFPKNNFLDLEKLKVTLNFFMLLVFLYRVAHIVKICMYIH